jgi:hypothetical protein
VCVMGSDSHPGRLQQRVFAARFTLDRHLPHPGTIVSVHLDTSRCTETSVKMSRAELARHSSQPVASCNACRAKR